MKKNYIKPSLKVADRILLPSICVGSGIIISNEPAEVEYPDGGDAKYSSDSFFDE